MSKLKATLGFDGKAFEAGMRKAQNITKKASANMAGSLKGAVAGVLSVGFLTQKAREVGEFARQVQDLAPSLGMTTDQLQEWEYVFARAGLEIDDVADAMATITDRAADAESGMTSMLDDFKLVGITVDQLKGKNPQQLFELFADAVANTEDKNAALASIVRTLGDDLGRKLAPMLLLGKEGLAAMRKEAQALGIVMDESKISEVAAQMVEIQIASMQLRGIWSDLTVVASQLFTKIQDGFKMIGSTDPLTQLFKGLKTFVGGSLTGEGIFASLKKAIVEVPEDFIKSFQNYEAREKAATSMRNQKNEPYIRKLQEDSNVDVAKKTAKAAKVADPTRRALSLTASQSVGAFARRTNPMLRVATDQLKVLESIKQNTTRRSGSTVENPYGSDSAIA